MDVGTAVQATYDFESTDPDELQLRAGDIIQIVQVIDDDWALGTTNGRTGRFPVSFVSVAPTAGNGVRAGQFVVAVETFHADLDGDLGFNKGDTIEIISQIDEDWLRGRIGAIEGIFPSTYVTDQEGKNDSGFTYTVTRSNIGQLNNELTFSEGDVLTNLEKIDDVWYRGSCKGITGLVPAVCVQEIEASHHGKSDYVQPQSDRANYGLINQRLSQAFQTLGEGEAVISESVETQPSAMETNSNAEPWATALFPFSAESRKELSFMDNERISLLYRIDNDWLVGSLDGNIGMFPASFVSIVVEVPESYDKRPQTYIEICQNDKDTKNTDPNSNDIMKSESLVVPQEFNNLHGEKGRILFDFVARAEQDLSVKKGDVVTIIEQLDVEWYEAQHSNGGVGFIPVSYVKILAKPLSPSLKRNAPSPPVKKDEVAAGTKPHPPTKLLPATEITSHKSIPNGAADVLDIFGPIPNASRNSKASISEPIILCPEIKSRPAIAPKPSPTHKPSGAINDFLGLDPFAASDAVNIPQSLPKLNSSGDSESFPVELSNGTKPSEISQTHSTFASNSETIVPSLIDFSPPDTPVVESAINTESKQSPKKSIKKEGSVDSLSGILSAKPYGAASTKVRSVHRPVSRNKNVTSPEKLEPKSRPSAEASHISDDVNTFNQQVNDVFVSVEEPEVFNPFQSGDSGQACTPLNTVQLAGDTVPRHALPPQNITPFSAAVEEIFAMGNKDKQMPRQPSPNPFAAAVTEESNSTCANTGAQQIRVQNPFSAEENLGFMDDFELNTLNDQQQLPGTMPRDDSMNSELSSDDLNSHLPCFVIRPVDTTERFVETQSTFKLPPPPSPAKRSMISQHPDKPKPKKFDPNTAVPRPRPRSSAALPLIEADGGLGQAVEPAQLATTFNQDLVGFGVDVDFLFVDNDDDSVGPPPPAYTPPELLSNLDEDHILQNESSVVFGDLLGLVTSEAVVEEETRPRRSAPPLPEQTKKIVPPRTAPPRPVSKPRYQAMKEDKDVVTTSQKTAVISTTKEMIVALKEYMSEFQAELEIQTQEKLQLEEEMKFLDCEDDAATAKHNDLLVNIAQLNQKIASLEDQIEELQPDPVAVAKKKKVPTATLR